MTIERYKQIILHAGLHKTGTSSIQNNCHKYRGWLRERGMEMPVLLRFGDILDSRISLLNDSFEKARAEADQQPELIKAQIKDSAAEYLKSAMQKEGEGEKWVADPEGQERFFAYYQMEEIDWLIQAAGFEVVGGWTGPPGQGQRHNWLNRFAVAQPWSVHRQIGKLVDW